MGAARPRLAVPAGEWAAASDSTDAATGRAAREGTIHHGGAAEIVEAAADTVPTVAAIAAAIITGAAIAPIAASDRVIGEAAIDQLATAQQANSATEAAAAGGSFHAVAAAGLATWGAVSTLGGVVDV